MSAMRAPDTSYRPHQSLARHPLATPPSFGTSTPQGHYLRYFKRATDLVLASLLLILGIPIIALAMIAIRLESPGSPLFRQRRIGRHGQSFVVYKLRTMRHNASDTFALLRDENGELRHKLKSDPRVTRLGNILRKSSIDELPQLLNVIRGEMSLVGPRPELPQIVSQYAAWQHERHAVRPGITGWWQVMGRSDRPMHENTELDIFYVRNCSLTLDLRILLRTVVSVIRGTGAY